MRSLSVLAGGVLLIGCATMMPELVSAPNIKHVHELLVTDQKGLPLPGVTVMLVAKNQKDKIRDTTLLSPENGIVETQIVATSDPAYPSIYAYSSNVDYELSMDGYYNSKGVTHSYKSGSKTEQIDSIQYAIDTVKMLKPTDFFAEKYLESAQKTGLLPRILAFIDIIRVEGFIADSYLEPYSIDLAEFKSKKYLKLGFDNSNVYNSLKLDKYDIGKRLFDEVIRKVLNPLNDHISSPKEFYGYNIFVIGYTKDFSNEYASNKKLVYNFIMPSDVISKYKDKELTGQGLLDAAVILLDDERIDLKLQ